MKQKYVITVNRKLDGTNTVEELPSLALTEEGLNRLTKLDEEEVEGLAAPKVGEPYYRVSLNASYSKGKWISDDESVIQLESGEIFANPYEPKQEMKKLDVLMALDYFLAVDRQLCKDKVVGVYYHMTRQMDEIDYIESPFRSMYGFHSLKLLKYAVGRIGKKAILETILANPEEERSYPVISEDLLMLEEQIETAVVRVDFFKKDSEELEDIDPEE